MNFLAIQQSVAENLGLSLAVTAQATQVKRYINQAYRAIMQAYDWPFLRAANPAVIQTATDYTTGTVTTVVASTTVTFSATIATSMTGRYFQSSSSRDWYRISAHTAGTATATLDTAAIYAGSALTYTIRKFYYALTATPTIDRVINIRQSITPFSLREVSKAVFDELRPDPTTTGTPRLYLMAGKDSNDVWQMTLWPTPDAVINLTVDYLQQPSDLSADADIPLVPEKWRQTVLVEGANAYGYKSLDDGRYTETWNNFIMGIGSMQTGYQSSGNKSRVMRSVDSVPNLGPIPFPENYPSVR